MADIFIPYIYTYIYNGVLSPQMVKFVCIRTAKSVIVCI